MTTKTTSVKDIKTRKIKAGILQFQTELQKLWDECERSYTLLDEKGEITGLSKYIESLVSDPLNSFYNTSIDIDQKIKVIIDTIIVRTFLQHKKDLIKYVAKAKTFSGTLHYAIVLNEDTIENRYSIYEFFDVFDSLELSKKFQVRFQFIPESIIPNLNVQEVINPE